MTATTPAKMTAAEYFDGMPFESFNLRNKDDVFDLVIDGFCSRAEIEIVGDRLYEDRRGGPLASLFANKEFMAAILAQMIAPAL